MRSIFVQPSLTVPRMAIAVGTAVVVDVMQMVLGPLGFFTPLDDVMDLVAAAVITWSIGFHPLLLPTFVVELVPIVDMLPTWTGCTVAVLLLRKRAQSAPTAPPQSAPADTDHMKKATVVEEPPPQDAR